MKRALLILWIFFLAAWGTAYAAEDEVWIKIDKSENRLYVLLNDYPVYSFPVATGITPAKTPEGTFHVTRKVKNPWYIPKNIPGGDPANPIGTRWLGLDVPGTNGYQYGIHGTNNPDSIGRRVSQGCIRMQNQNVEWIFQHIPLGTRVWITP